MSTLIRKPFFVPKLIFAPLLQMNYGVSAVQLDFAKIVHMKTLAFFDIPGNRSPTEIVSVIYLILFLTILILC